MKIYRDVETRRMISREVKMWAINARTQAPVFCTFAIIANVRDGKKRLLADESQIAGSVESSKTASPGLDRFMLQVQHESVPAIIGRARGFPTKCGNAKV
ncbi:MAG: hypothetical protein ACYDH9_17945 [Limisphaerales bacterium]